MADQLIETRTPDQLPRVTAISPDALVAVQEEGGPVGAMAIKQLLGRLVQVDTTTETEAELQADLDHDDSTVGLVFADPDPAKNGWYRKVGDSGEGEWSQFEKLSAYAAAEIAEYVSQATNAADTAAVAAAAALAAAGVGEYADTAAGIGATAEGETFFIDNGDGTGTVYRHDPGPVATEIRRFVKDQTADGAAALLAGGLLEHAIKYVTPEMFGAKGDFDPDTGDGTVDTAAFNLMKAHLAAKGGGEVLLAQKYLIGDVDIDIENVVLRGLNNNCGIGVLDGTLGLLFSASYSYATNLTYWSQSGDPDDGLNTRGEKYSKGVSNQSIGHMNPCNVIFKNFSGVPRECVNLVHAEFGAALFVLCKRGPVISKGGAGGADFSTTVNFANQFVLFCGDGGTINGLQGAHYDVILQANETPMVVNGGRFTCSAWLEANETGAITCNDAFVNFTEITTKPGNNAIVRNWSGGVTPAATRGYREFNGFDITAKSLKLLSLYGVDPKSLSGVGTTATVGLKFNEAIVPMVYGDDLLDPAAWVSDNTTEFAGWDVTNGGYKIATALTGIRGMKQGLMLDAAKIYVVVMSSKNVSGNPIATVQVDGTTRTPGVPFTVAATGSKVVRAYANQAAASENYIQSFRLMEVLEDQSQLAKTTDRLLRTPKQRADLYLPTAPAAGYWATGETYRAQNPSNGVFQYGNVAGGTPGTWRQTSHAVLRNTTANRPVLTANDVGVKFFDTTLAAAGKPIWWTGTTWVDAAGVAV